MKIFINKFLSELKYELNKLHTLEAILIVLFFTLFFCLCCIFLYLCFVAIFNNFKEFLLFISPFVIISLGVYYLKKYLNSRDDL